MAQTVAAVILAGGQSSRMGGGDKPLRLLAGQTILSHIISRLQPDHAQIAISANGALDRFGAFGLPVIADEVSVGPLAGILSGLRWAERLDADSLLTVPADCPFLPRRLASALAPAPTLAASAGRRHPTVALWPVTARAALEAYLRSLGPARPGDFSVTRFADRLGARTLCFDIHAGDPFLNINTPGDLELARARAAAND